MLKPGTETWAEFEDHGVRATSRKQSHLLSLWAKFPEVAEQDAYGLSEEIIAEQYQVGVIEIPSEKSLTPPPRPSYVSNIMSLGLLGVVEHGQDGPEHPDDLALAGVVIVEEYGFGVLTTSDTLEVAQEAHHRLIPEEQYDLFHLCNRRFT